MSTVQKVAVITGASQGIGAALVNAYRDRDYHVVATSRSIQPSTDDGVVTVPGNVGARNTADRVIAEAVGRFGRIDTLINNAGIFIAKPFTEYTDADYAAILDVNLAGFFHMTQLAIAEMEKRGSGHVVQVTTSLVNHANSAVPVRAGVTDEGWLGCRDQITRHRIRKTRYSCERCCTRHHQDADAFPSGVRTAGRSASCRPYG
jgi:NAD(P)-dependent dehydrogenase (short-subunit alcohol dehydrogenase family)